MNFRALKRVCLLLSLLYTLLIACGKVSAANAPPPPSPILIFLGSEEFEANGKQWVRYNYGVFNFDQYPDELFVASPNLPPCGKNTKAARTWVDLYQQNGQRLNGFCALVSNRDLRRIWFALEQGLTPPSWIYIELTDRQSNQKYKSNLAETVL